MESVRFSTERRPSAPCRPPCRKASSNNIYNQSMRKFKFSSASRELPKNYPTNPSIPKRMPKDSLDEEIKRLLREKLVRRIVKGRPFETIEFHRRQMLKELGAWMGVLSEDKIDCFRNRLLTLLNSESKQKSNDVPLDNSEWTKLLGEWLKTRTSGGVLSNREIYKILAVDGFRGFRPGRLKYYLSQALNTLRHEYESHVRGVRCMYDFFEKNDGVSGLTGTDSACVVFMALIDWYSLRMKDDVMVDDQVAFQVRKVRWQMESKLRQHVDYFPDLRNVDEELLDKLGRVYAEQFKEDESWKVVGRELLTNLQQFKD